MDKCKICDNISDNSYYNVKERMLGLREVFQYMECGKCGCLQLVNVPEDLSRYYPSDYYSYKKMRNKNTLLDKAIMYYYTQNKKIGIVACLICRLFPELLPPIEPRANVFDKKVLDVGCGTGKLLIKLGKAGFTNLFGVDKFIEKNVKYSLPNQGEGSIQIAKGEVFDIHEKFDVIMLNHSFEHMTNQEEVLSHINTILDNKGICIIRIPTVSSLAWKKYREDWFQLDAPRHIYLHSVTSIEKICKKYELKIERIVFDSMRAMSLVRSKLYRKEWTVKKQNDFLTSPIGFLYLCKEVIT